MVEKLPHPTHWAARVRKTAAGVAAIRGRPRRVVVKGASMRPAFQAGDRLIVVPVATVGPGQVVAVRDPREPARILVKRVHAVSGDRLDVRGDNPVESTDSRHFGAVPRNRLVGLVVYRYHPGGRAGWVGG